VGIVGVGIKVRIVVIGIILLFLSGLLFFEVGTAPVGIVGQPEKYEVEKLKKLGK
jgi:hypothetical protein